MSELIEEIVSESAFAQLDKLDNKLEKSTILMSKAIIEAEKYTKTLAGTANVKEYNDAQAKSELALKKVELAAKQLLIAEEKLAQAKIKSVADSEKAAVAAEKAAQKEIQANEKRARSNSAAFQAENDANIATSQERERLGKTTNDLMLAENAAASAAASLIATRQQENAASSAAAAIYTEEENKLRSLATTAAELKIQITALSNEQKILDTQYENGKISASQYAVKSGDIRLEQETLKTALGDINKELKAQAVIVTNAKDSYNAMDAELKQLLISYKAFSEEEKKSQAGKDMLLRINELTKSLKDQDAAMGIHNRSVGDYGKALENVKGTLLGLIPGGQQFNAALQTTGGLISSLQTLFGDYIGSLATITAAQTAAAEATAAATAAREALAAGTITAAEAEAVFATSTAASTAATEAGTVGLRAFKIALISTGIGAIIVLLGSLIAYFTSTQEGINTVTKVLDPLKVAFNLAFQAVAEFGGMIVKAFENPKQAMKDLYEFVKNNLINRFTAFKVILDGIVNLDFKKLTNGLAQAATGIENLVDKGQAFINKVGGISEELTKLKLQRDKEAVTDDLQIARLNTIARQQGEIARDASKSSAVRASAAKKAIQAVNDELALKNSVLDLDLKILKLENSTKSKTYATEKAQNDILQKQEENIASAAQQRIRLKAALNKALAVPVDTSDEDIEKARLERAKSTAKAIVENDKLEFEQRTIALQQFIEAETKITDEEYDKAVKKAKGNAGKIRVAQEKHNTDLADIQIEANKLGIKLMDDLLSDEEKLRIKANQDQLDLIGETEATKYDLLNAALLKGTLTEKGYAKLRLDIQREYLRKYIQAEIDQAQELVDKSYLTVEQRADAEKKLAALKLKLSREVTKNQIEDNKEVTDAEKKDLDKRVELNKQFSEAKKQLLMEVGNLGATIANASFENEKNRFQAQIDLGEKQKQIDIDNVTNSIATEQEKADKIKVIEAQAEARKEALEQKQKEVSIRQAKFQKAMNVVSILGNTAVAVMKTYAEFGFPLGIPLAIAQAAIGAVQVASVLATPIPTYFTGTPSSKGGLALTDELGPEGYITPQGKAFIGNDRPTLRNLQAGTKIIPHHEMVKMMGNPSNIGKMRSEKMDVNMLILSQQNETKKLIKAMDKNKARSTNIHFTNMGDYISRNF